MLLVVLWLYDVRLALVATAFVPVLVASVAVHHPAAQRRSREAMESAARLSAHLVEDVSGVGDGQGLRGRAVAVRGRGRRGSSCSSRSLFSLQKLGISMNTLGTLVTTLAGIVILWYGGHRVMDGALTIGELMFFYTLLGYLLETAGAAGLGEPEAPGRAGGGRPAVPGHGPGGRTDRRRQGGASSERVRDAIELRGVGFQYGCRAAVLEGVDLRIPAGKDVAIVGESGSGKSTLLKLLMRLLRPHRRAHPDRRVDLRDFELASLRARIGLVSQEPFIFSGTVRENIALGRPGATRERGDRRRPAPPDWTSSSPGLPERYETVIGERGANLSGGQRQRLAIARALLRQPEILIFDEATSHLDTATERAIQETSGRPWRARR